MNIAWNCYSRKPYSVTMVHLLNLKTIAAAVDPGFTGCWVAGMLTMTAAWFYSVGLCCSPIVYWFGIVDFNCGSWTCVMVCARRCVCTCACVFARVCVCLCMHVSVCLSVRESLVTSSFQETGNRMTEQNLAMILGPNILTKEVKVCVCMFCLSVCM